MDELKPCPFCGSEAVELTGLRDNWFDVSCSNIKCTAYKIACVYKTKEKARKAWNTRAKESERE